MARFILDVANCDSKRIEKIIHDDFQEMFGGDVARIVVIDETNNCQFSDNPMDDKLSDDQIIRYYDELKLMSM